MEVVMAAKFWNVVLKIAPQDQTFAMPFASSQSRSNTQWFDMQIPWPGVAQNRSIGSGLGGWQPRSRHHNGHSAIHIG